MNLLALSAELRRKGFFHLLSANFLTQFLGFATLLCVARFLQPAEVGQIKIIQAYAAVFVLLGGFGINTALLKACAERQDEDRARGILKTSFKKVILGSTCSTALLWMLARTGVLTASSELIFWLPIYGLMIPFALVTDLLIVYLQSQKRIKAMARAQAVVRLISFCVITVCTLKWGLAGFIVSSVLSYLLGLLPLFYHVKLDFLKTRSPGVVDGFATTATLSFLANGVNALGFHSDIYVLDRYCSQREQIGYYALAVLLMQAGLQVTRTAQSIATPYLCEHARSRDRRAFATGLIKAQLQVAGLSVFVCVGLLGASWAAVEFFYGPGYRPTLQYVMVLSLRFLFLSSSSILGVGLLAMGRIHLNLVIVCITVPLQFVMAYVMFQKHGVMGVAWTQVAAAAMAALLTMGAAWWVLREPARTKHRNPSHTAVAN